LCRIDVKLEARGEGSRREVSLTVTDGDETSVLVTRTARMRAPASPRWVAFQFAPLATPAGRRLAFGLSVRDQAAATSVAVHVAPDGGPVFEAFVLRAVAS
jgi:hypothetical protein